MKGELLAFGYEARVATLDAELRMWFFYDAGGALLVRVPHELITRVKDWLETRADAQLDADIDALMKQNKRSW